MCGQVHSSGWEPGSNDRASICGSTWCTSAARSLDQRIVPPAMHVWYGRKCDSVDCASDPITSLPVHLAGASVVKGQGKFTRPKASELLCSELCCQMMYPLPSCSSCKCNCTFCEASCSQPGVLGQAFHTGPGKGPFLQVEILYSLLVILVLGYLSILY